MQTLIVRHRKENLNKCSLHGLEERDDCCFYSYPGCHLPDLTGYVLLAFEGPELSPADLGIVLVDATWRYAEVMVRNTLGLAELPRRSLPHHYRTAYPRKQEDCPDPLRGLASVEALYLAYMLMGRETGGLLDHYYWRQRFLQINLFPRGL